MKHNRPIAGFTLIEMSIVLVIIGLLVGGVLVGQDLIRAAYVRASISQIEKYNTAVNTFYGKYQALPGDMGSAAANQYGFTTRGSWAGEGDSNGIIQGESAAGASCGFCVVTGESSLFWSDLSGAHLIEGQYTFRGASGVNTTGTAIDKYIPESAVGGFNHIYVWGGGASGAYLSDLGDGRNYFGMSTVTDLGNGWAMYSTPGLTVRQAYNIDSKIDDGLPQSGEVMAWYYNFTLQNYHPSWAAGDGLEGMNVGHAPGTTAVLGSHSTCYDNNGTTTAPTYSLSQQNGAGLNCALSFQFHAGD